MSKSAEKISILRSASEGVLQRLSWVKKICSSPTQRPVFVGDNAYAKITAALLEKFPEFKPNVDKTQGWDLIAGRSKQLMDGLCKIY